MTHPVSRRALLGAVAALPLGVPARAAAAPPLRFLFVTDTHIQPELNAAAGCRAAFTRARALGGDFVIQGGDHVFDALGATRTRATDLMALYTETEQAIGLPVHHLVGNHDCLGIYPGSGVEPTDPLYGKKFFADRFGPTFRSFTHRGVHFVLLDSIGLTADRKYEGRIDPAQLAWLRQDLATLPPATPIVVATHIPLLTNFAMGGVRRSKIAVVNSAEVLDILRGHRVLAVLQGHNHVNETVTWEGIPFMTCGAVCGAWWHGPNHGTPEGFTAVTIEDGRLTTEYVTYGFQSVAPRGRG